MGRYLVEAHLVEGRSVAELAAAHGVHRSWMIDRFVTAYNDQRPHRALGRRTPREVFDTKIKARPTGDVPDTHFRVRHDRVDKTGCVTLRYQSQLRHISVGRAHKGQRVVLLVADTDVRVVTEDGEPLRHITIDPTRDYQPRGTTRCLRCPATSVSDVSRHHNGGGDGT